jgi:enoyl-CoA hydratase/carnithine racemase
VAAPPILTEQRDGVLVITLNRPDQRNAVNGALAEGMAAALDLLDGNEELRIGVVSGAGKGFCAGMDLKAFARGEPVDAGGRGFGGIAEQPASKPLIAAVEAFALAGGLEVALACDLIVASRGTRLAITEVKRGLVPAAGGLLRLQHRVPYHLALEMALTGDPITAERAAEVGLVNRLVDPGETLGAALELAAEIAANAPLAVAACKRMLLEAPGWPEQERWARQLEIADPIFASEDAHEGAVAFAERRPPVWRGR